MVKIIDLTLRDAHQSLLATRLKTEDIIPILDVMDSIGFYSMEVWGGATFDVPLRYLNEDPWVRLKLIRERVKKTKLQMLLRGKNLVGYRHYPDDICIKFVEKAFDNGIDIFRIFDALNDLRNVEVTVKAAKKVGAEIQLCMVYTISPVHTLEYYVALARNIASMDVNSICIKDMSGVLKPYVAYELVHRIKSEIGIPVDVHSHATAGFSPITLIKSIEAGADYVDCVLSSMSMYTSHPPFESIISALEDTPYEVEGVNLKLALKASKYFWEKRKKYSEYDYALKNPPVDVNVLEHQIPGGMLSNLIEQLKIQNAEERLNEVLDEVPRVRRDLGYPPLVTPLSQIVGTQTVVNVLSGKPYSNIIREVKDYIRGLYGKPPGEINPELIRKVLEEETVEVKPELPLESSYDKIIKELPSELVEKEEDYLTYALFPDIAIKYFNFRREYKSKINVIYEIIVGREIFRSSFS